MANGEYPLRNIAKPKAVLLLAVLLVSGVFIADQAWKATTGISPIDPVTAIIYADTLVTGNLNGFNTILSNYGAGPVIAAVPNSTHASVALTDSPYDFSQAAGKHLVFGFNFRMASYPATNTQWGIYLTRNGTLPLTPGYDPRTDVNVALIFSNDRASLTSPTVQGAFLMQRDALQSVSAGDPGGCAQSGTCFYAPAYSVDFVVSNPLAATLNYTGTQGAGGNHGRSTVLFNTPSASVFVQPWFQISAQQYYVGYWQSKTTDGGTLTWRFGGTNCNNSSVALDCFEIIYVWVPTPTAAVQPPALDTGGFFGPVIRALIGIAVFILQAIAQFLGFVADAFITAMNAVGSFFGLGAIGTAIRDALTGTANFIVNVFAVTVGWAVTLASLFQNGIAFITNFFSGSNGFIAWLVSFFSTLPGIWTIIQDLWTALNTVVLTMNQILVIYYLAGMFMVYMNGWPGFRDWLQIGTTFTVKIFHLGFTIGKEMFQIILDVKRLLAQWI